MSCTCNTAGGNTGVPFCSPLQGVMHNLIIVPKYGSDGSLNAIDLENDTLSEQYFIDKFNAPNGKDRFFPLPFMENVENTRAEALNETANSGNIYRIKQGTRTLTGAMFKQSPRFLEKLEKWLCIDFGVYEIDNTGALAGTLSADGKKLYPRYVLQGSFDGNYNYATDTTVQKIVISFQYDNAVKDSQIGLITAENLGGADLLNSNGLFDLHLKNESATATELTADFVLDYGDVLNPIKIEGLTSSEIAIYNETDGQAVVIDSATENPAGRYEVAYSSGVISGDVLRVSLVKEGYAPETYVKVTVS